MRQSEETQKKEVDKSYWRGFYNGKRAQVASILRYVQMAIVVAATFVILRGCDMLVTLQ
jgi:hypothetical protein